MLRRRRGVGPQRENVIYDEARKPASARPQTNPHGDTDEPAPRGRGRAALLQWPLAAAAPTCDRDAVDQEIRRGDQEGDGRPVAAKAACAGGPPPRTWPRAASSAVTTVGGTTAKNDSFWVVEREGVGVGKEVSLVFRSEFNATAFLSSTISFFFALCSPEYRIAGRAHFRIVSSP